MATYLPYLVLAAILILFAVQLGRIFSGYQLATGTRWQRFLAAFSYSHTILLSRVGTFLAAVSVWAVNFLPAIDPSTQLGGAIQAALKPEYSVYYALAYSLLVEYVRRRASSVDPILPPPQAVVVPPPPVTVSE